MATKSRPMSAPETMARAEKNPLKFLGTKARNYSAAGGPRLGMAPSERHDEARDRALHDALG
jgi:hypothetical protein